MQIYSRRSIKIAAQAVIAIALVVGSPAFATTGKELQSLSPEEQRGFIRGAVEGLVYAGSVALMAGQNRLGDFLIEHANCLNSQKPPNNDMHGLVMKYLKAHQENLGQDAARLVRMAIVSTCGADKKK